jgi:hypothetical protein
MITRVRQHDQLGKFDSLVVEKGVMENKQQANHDDEHQAGGQSLANHCWQAILVALIHEKGLGPEKFLCARKGDLSSQSWRIPWPTRLKKPA